MTNAIMGTMCLTPALAAATTVRAIVPMNFTAMAAPMPTAAMLGGANRHAFAQHPTGPAEPPMTETRFEMSGPGSGKTPPPERMGKGVVTHGFLGWMNSLGINVIDTTLFASALAAFSNISQDSLLMYGYLFFSAHLMVDVGVPFMLCNDKTGSEYFHPVSWLLRKLPVDPSTVPSQPGSTID